MSSEIDNKYVISKLGDEVLWDTYKQCYIHREDGYNYEGS